MFPELKIIGDNTNVNSILANSKSKINDYNATGVGAKHLHATADYSEVLRAKSEIAQVYSKNVVIDVEYRGRRTGQTAIPNAKGTNYHPGGDMIVNDQSGPLYKELVQFLVRLHLYLKVEMYIPSSCRNEGLLELVSPNRSCGAWAFQSMLTVWVFRRSSLVRNLRSMSPSVEPTSTDC